jgi:hypothetical protein
MEDNTSNKWKEMSKIIKFQFIESYGLNELNLVIIRWIRDFVKKKYYYFMTEIKTNISNLFGRFV